MQFLSSKRSSAEIYDTDLNDTRASSFNDNQILLASGSAEPFAYIYCIATSSQQKFESSFMSEGTDDESIQKSSSLPSLSSHQMHPDSSSYLLQRLEG